jgi:sRNA-binding protein
VSGADQQKAIATIAHLAEAYPQCFFVHGPHRRPLKVGIGSDQGRRTDIGQDTAEVTYQELGLDHRRVC